MEEEAPVCRFCLETDEPLIRACRCSGSVGRIHTACLIKWFAMNPNPETNHQCNLCLAYYQIQTSHDEEDIPTEESLVSLFFTNPLLFCAGTHYFLFFVPILKWEETLKFYPYYLITLHSVYFSMLAKYVPVKNIKQYFKAFATYKRLYHSCTYLLAVLLTFQFYIAAGGITTLGLFYFYEQHIDILHQLNRDIIIDFIPYEDDNPIFLQEQQEPQLQPEEQAVAPVLQQQS